MGENLKFVGTPKFVSHFLKANVKITQICAGNFHSLAVSLEGKLFAWGEGSMGQLGMNRKVKYLFKPTIVDFMFSPISEGSGNQQIDSICAGYGHTVILSKGKVFTVGLNC